MARFRLELGPVPLHHQVYLDLHGGPRFAATCAPGDRLPPERELAQPLRLQPDHRPARARASSPARVASSGRAGRGTFVLQPRIERDFAGTLSFTEEMQRRGLDPETRLVAARRSRPGKSWPRALDLEVGSPIALPRAAPARRRGAAAARAGPPAGRAVSRAAGLRPRAQLPLRRPDRALRHARSSRAREALEPVLLRAREARLLGPAAASPRPPRRGHRLRPPDGKPDRVRPDVRPRRPDPLLRRAHRGPLEPPERQ